MNEWKERVITEKQELDNKIVGCSNAIKKFNTMDLIDRQKEIAPAAFLRLQTQLAQMSAYSNTLNERILLD